jgi:phosphoribosylformylglycinamidine synthase I
MRIGVLRFPGSNCDDDSLHVVNKVLKEDGRFVWHKETALPSGTDAVVVPGGFSYGDYLRAIAAHSPIMDAVRAFAAAGGPVLGICNGFQILCEAGLLPGALTRNASLRFECHFVHVRLEGKPTPFTSAIPAGRVLRLPIAHAEGRFVHDEAEALGKADRKLSLRLCHVCARPSVRRHWVFPFLLSPPPRGPRIFIMCAAASRVDSPRLPFLAHQVLVMQRRGNVHGLVATRRQAHCQTRL